LNLKGFLIDLDGSIYRGNMPLPYSKEFIEFLREQGIKFLFLTNNSTQLPIEYVRKLKSMNIESDENEILTSGVATAIYLYKFKKERKILCNWRRGIKESYKRCRLGYH